MTTFKKALAGIHLGTTTLVWLFPDAATPPIDFVGMPAIDAFQYVLIGIGLLGSWILAAVVLMDW